MSNSAHEFYQYVTVAERDMLWGLYVTGAGSMQIPPGGSYPLRTHPKSYHVNWPNRRVLPEYQVLYITRGQGEFESKGGGRHKITAGSVFVTFPGDRHRYRPTPSVGWDEMWIGFKGESADRLVENGFLSLEFPVLRTGLNEAVRCAFLSVLDRVRAQPPGYQQLAAASVMEILGAALTAERVGPGGSRHDALVDQARAILDMETTRPSSIDDLAGSLRLSPAQFRRVFKMHTGMPPYQYYLLSRINRAKVLLSETSLTVKEISSMLHFENPYHFSKAFKQKAGKSPADWRAIYQSKGGE